MTELMAKKINSLLTFYLYEVLKERGVEIKDELVSTSSKVLPYIIKYNSEDMVYIDSLNEEEGKYIVLLRLVYSDRVVEVLDVVEKEDG